MLFGRKCGSGRQYWETETAWLASCWGLRYPSHVESSVWVARVCWPFDSGTKSMAEITELPISGPAEPQWKIAHKSLWENNKGLVPLISKLFILSLKNTHAVAQLHWHAHIYMQRIKPVYRSETLRRSHIHRSKQSCWLNWLEEYWREDCELDK